MPSYHLESLTSSNVGHVFAAIGLTSALESYGGCIGWKCADAPSHPTLTADADDEAIESAIIEAVRVLLNDWQTILPQCFARNEKKSKKQKKDDDGDQEVESAWIGCEREALYAVFDGLPPRLRARLAPWASMIAVDPKDKRYTYKPRTQLSKTKFTSFFAPALLTNVVKIHEAVGILECLKFPLAYLGSMTWSDTEKTSYDVAATMKDGGKPQSTVGATMSHPLIEALILLGIEVASLKPSTRMPRSRITRRGKTGEELVLPLWTVPLSFCEIEAHLFDTRTNECLIVPFADNGKNIVPIVGSYGRDRKQVKRKTNQRLA